MKMVEWVYFSWCCKFASWDFSATVRHDWISLRQQRGAYTRIRDKPSARAFLLSVGLTGSSRDAGFLGIPHPVKTSDISLSLLSHQWIQFGDLMSLVKKSTEVRLDGCAVTFLVFTHMIWSLCGHVEFLLENVPIKQNQYALFGKFRCCKWGQQKGFTLHKWSLVQLGPADCFSLWLQPK